jgi:hypothetical protein
MIFLLRERYLSTINRDAAGMRPQYMGKSRIFCKIDKEKEQAQEDAHRSGGNLSEAGICFRQGELTDGGKGR